MFELDHYLKKVLPEHRKPKFIAWLRENLKAAAGSEELINKLDSVFDLETAYGAQLNILGEVIGRVRLLDFEPFDGSGSLLEDEMYRLLLKAKIGINHWAGTIPDVYELWENLFPEYDIFIRDNQDMTMDTYILGPFPSLLRELAENNYIVPKPMAVGMNYHFIQRLEIFCLLYLAMAALRRKTYVLYNATCFTIYGKRQLFLATTCRIRKKYVIYNSGAKKQEAQISAKSAGHMVGNRKYKVWK